jgi:hypothetical protein
MRIHITFGGEARPVVFSSSARLEQSCFSNNHKRLKFCGTPHHTALDESRVFRAFCLHNRSIPMNLKRVPKARKNGSYSDMGHNSRIHRGHGAGHFSGRHE